MAPVKGNNGGKLKYLYEILKILGWIISRLGLAGFLAMIIILFVVIYASEEQKRDIVDKYVLFKDGIGYPGFVILILTIVILVQRSTIQVATRQDPKKRSTSTSKTQISSRRKKN